MVYQPLNVGLVEFANLENHKAVIQERVSAILVILALILLLPQTVLAPLQEQDPTVHVQQRIFHLVRKIP